MEIVQLSFTLVNYLKDVLKFFGDLCVGFLVVVSCLVLVLTLLEYLFLDIQSSSSDRNMMPDPASKNSHVSSARNIMPDPASKEPQITATCSMITNPVSMNPQITPVRSLMLVPASKSPQITTARSMMPDPASKTTPNSQITTTCNVLPDPASKNPLIITARCMIPDTAPKAIPNLQTTNLMPDPPSMKTPNPPTITARNLLFPTSQDHNVWFWEMRFHELPEIPVILKYHRIIFLPRVDKAYNPKLLFKCTVCPNFFSSLSLVNDHIKNSEHLNKLQWFFLSHTSLLSCVLPDALGSKLNEHLMSVYNKCKMSSGNVRSSICERLNGVVAKHMPGCSIHMYGSSMHGMGLEESDLNLALKMDDKAGHSEKADALVKLRRILCDEGYRKVNACFHAEYPQLTFFSDESEDILCNLTLYYAEGISLSRLLLQYSLIDEKVKILCVLLRAWAKLCQIDKLEKGSLPPYCLYILVISFLQKGNKNLIPTLPASFVEKFLDPGFKVEKENVSWTRRNDISVVSLWISLLEYYANATDSSKQQLISIAPPISKVNNDRNKRFFSVIDPYCTKNARAVLRVEARHYIRHCFSTSHLYYSVPQTKQGAIFGFVRPEMECDDLPGLKDILNFQNTLNSLLIQLVPHVDSSYVNDSEETKRTLLSEIRSMTSTRSFVNLCHLTISEKDLNERPKTPPQYQYKSMVVSVKDAEFLMNRFNPEKVHYDFCCFSFTRAKTPPRCCSVCSQSHGKDECPETALPPLEELDEIRLETVQMMDALCQETYYECLPSLEEDRERDDIVKDIETYLKLSYPSAKLTLFGSSKNGFGLKNADLDICMTYANSDKELGLIPPTEALVKVFKKLKCFGQARSLNCIKTAKVPIIKFTHFPSGLQGDISLYNVLAQENTRLLKKYSEIDERVKILGTMMKRFSKFCQIGDASKGSLSSYSYTLMVIFYLQRCNPPVLPVLQEIYQQKFEKLQQTGYELITRIPQFTSLEKPEGESLERIVEDCDCSFFDDLKILRDVWPEYGCNKLSVGEHWLNMLNFYVDVFDYENMVIAIRTSRDMSKFHKNWLNKNIAIEDPFNTRHNLGSGLSRRMSCYIIRAFRKGKAHFASLPPEDYPGTIQDYYFDPNVLSSVEPPNDRGCFLCKNIGHQSRSCPMRRRERRPPPRMCHLSQVISPDVKGYVCKSKSKGSAQRKENWRTASEKQLTLGSTAKNSTGSKTPHLNNSIGGALKTEPTANSTAPVSSVKHQTFLKNKKKGK